jgi:hypothetical protein
MAERVSEAEAEAAARKRADEQLEQIRGKVEQLQSKAAATAASTSGASDPAEVRELKKYNDDLLVSHPSNPLLKLVLTSLSIAAHAPLRHLQHSLAVLRHHSLRSHILPRMCRRAIVLPCTSLRHLRVQLCRIRRRRPVLLSPILSVPTRNFLPVT